MSILALQIEKPYWQDVLIALAEKGLPITAALVHTRDVKDAPNQFFKRFKVKQVNGKKFFRIEDLSKELYKDFGNSFPALSGDIIKALEPAERDFYNLTDRFSFFPLSFRYRKRLWREAIRYWLAFFESNNITTLFLACVPHNLADYSCFHVAKYLGLKTVIIGHTMINDHIILRNDYREDNIKVPAGFMPGASNEELVRAINPQLYTSATTDSKVLQYVIAKNDASVGKKEMNTKPQENNIDWQRGLKQFNKAAFKAPRFKAALAMNGVYPPLVRRIIKLYEIANYKIQRQRHDALAVTPDLNAKYIYFAMHLQPERTSTPEAEIFEDHFLAINLLAKSLPQGWKLYVKENPRQFDKINFIKGHHQRDRSDYEDFLKLPNVQLISQKIPSKDLVKNAQVVSTLSGSVGWEALKAGKPVIIFANAWYSACPSAYRVNNIEETKAAIAAARNSTPEKVENDMLRYLAYMQPTLAVGNMGQNSYLRSAALPYDEIVSKMADRLAIELAPADAQG